MEREVLDLVHQCLSNPENSGILCIDNHGLVIAGRGDLRQELAGQISHKVLTENASLLRDTDGSEIQVATHHGFIVAVKKVRTPTDGDGAQ